MTQPALLAVAHGSRNPAAADVIKTIARQIRRMAPVLDVRVAFVSHAEPSLRAELGAAGSNSVIVPLLLSTGYHLTADITGAASSAGVQVASPLGPDELLLTALTARLSEAGVPDGTPIVLAAAGSSDPAGAADVQQQAGPAGRAAGCAGRWRVRDGCPANGAGSRCRLARPHRTAGRRGQLPAGARPLPGSASQQRRRLGDRAAGRAPGPGRPRHRALSDGS